MEILFMCQNGMLIKFKFKDFPWNKTFQREMLDKITATKDSWTNIGRLKNQSTACQRIAEFFAAAVRRNNNTLYSGGAVRPEKFPSNGYPNWEDWKTHFGDFWWPMGWRTSSAQWLYRPVSPVGRWTSSPRCPKCIKPEWMDSQHPRCKGCWAAI